MTKCNWLTVEATAEIANSPGPQHGWRIIDRDEGERAIYVSGNQFMYPLLCARSDVRHMQMCHVSLRLNLCICPCMCMCVCVCVCDDSNSGSSLHLLIMWLSQAAGGHCP